MSDMPPSQPPQPTPTQWTNAELAFQHIMLRSLCRAAAPAGKLARWFVTGTAAVLAIVIANIDRLVADIAGECLRWGIILLVAGLIFGTASIILAAAVRNGMKSLEKLYAEFHSANQQGIIDEVRQLGGRVLPEISKPLFGPLKWAFALGGRRGAGDPLAGYKFHVWILSLMVWLSLAQYVTSLAGVIVLACGIHPSASGCPNLGPR